jgi:invasion protein IalB
MKDQVDFAARVICRVAAAVVLAAVAADAGMSQALAQQPAPKAQPKAQPKADPKSAPATPPGQQPPGEPQLTYSPWTKVCQKGPNDKRLCFIGKDGRIESGQPVVAAVVIEPEGEPRKTLRVTLPLGMSLQSGTRVIVDSGQPMTGPYVICFPTGCMADYEASNELITKMKTGQDLHVQGLNGSGQPISLTLPLADFAKAYDGPATDIKDLEQQQKK